MKYIDILMNALFQQKGLDLTKNQVLLMRFISRGIKNQSDLSVITERNKSSLTRLIQSLEKKELVTRKTYSEDKRQQLVELTEAGEEMLSKAIPVLETSFQKVEEGIDQQELQTAKTVIARILDNVELELEQLNKL